MYYQFHGKSLLYLPEEITNRPKTEFIQWHNENVYKRINTELQTQYSSSFIILPFYSQPGGNY